MEQLTLHCHCSVKPTDPSRKYKIKNKLDYFFI